MPGTILRQSTVKVLCFVVKVNTSINHLLKSGLSRIDHENVFLPRSHLSLIPKLFQTDLNLLRMSSLGIRICFKKYERKLTRFWRRIQAGTPVFWISFQIGLGNQELHFHFLICTSITITTTFFNFSIFFARWEWNILPDFIMIQFVLISQLSNSRKRAFFFLGRILVEFRMPWSNCIVDGCKRGSGCLHSFLFFSMSAVV